MYDSSGGKLLPLGKTLADYNSYTVGSSTTPTYVSGGLYGANPDPENGMTAWFNRITSGYWFEPAFDSKPNWDAIQNALAIHGSNNVYLYQNHGYTPYGSGPGTPCWNTVSQTST